DLIFGPAIRDHDALALDIAGLFESLAKGADAFREPVRRYAAEKPDHRDGRLLRMRRERPRRRRTAECDQQFPPSDGDCHTPLPCEVRKGNDSTPRACCP